MTAENYHLKWDSHLSHLNTSIATLYRNDKFADVMLYSSSPEMGFPRLGISAHKFILSSSSQFFASIFDSTLPATTSSGVFHIVLPPDLTQRTIQILVQYIYSGETTVPNDILSEVLRGGELLKIRGLCRASPLNPEESHKSNSKINSIESSNCSRFANELRGLGASVLPEESPVIMKSPKPLQKSLLRIVDCTSLSAGITVNKEVAIDPDPDEPKFSYPENTEHCPPTMRTSCRESGCTGCSELTDMDCPPEIVQAPKLTMRTDLHHSSQTSENKSSAEHNGTYRRISLTTDLATKTLRQPSPDEQMNCFQIKEESFDCWHVDQTACDEPPAKVVVPKLLLKLKVPRETDLAPIKIETPTSAEEECSESPFDNVERTPYSRLTCDVCKKSFDEPKDWVRHIESHAEKPKPDKDSDNSSSPFSQPPCKTYLPKKRKHIFPYETPARHVTLMCDLCTKPFPTPAEWVRHLNTQHTETELAKFNKQRNAAQQKLDAEEARYNKRRNVGGQFKAVFHRNKLIGPEVQRSAAQDLDKICDVCTKRFLSNSLMIEHRKTHPGEG